MALAVWQEDVRVGLVAIARRAHGVAITVGVVRVERTEIGVAADPVRISRMAP
jgi:hypothetical protein